MFEREKRYCTHCGAVDVPKTVISGNPFVEIMLWCCGLLPGIVYGSWRRSTKREVCPRCGATNMIPLSSPMAPESLIPDLPTAEECEADKCEKCGAQLAPEIAFCPYCGTRHYVS